jgi:tetratricopeptide (TPR) repeat protein
VKDLQKSYQRSIYFEFLKIEQNAWKEKVRFFERQYEDILDLEYNDQIEIYYDYTQALYELGDYQHYINIVDELILSVIEHNVTHIKDENVYNNLLFRKACSHFNREELDEGKHILGELIKIDPTNQTYTKAYFQFGVNHAVQIPKSLQVASAINLFLFILTSVAELLLLNPFFGEWQGVVTFLKMTFLILSFAPALVYFVKIYFKTYREVSGYLKYAKEKQKNKANQIL